MDSQQVMLPPTEWPQLPDPSMLDKIIDVIATEGRVDRALIKPEATIETLGLESMDVVMILAGLEDVLDTYIPMNADLSNSRNLAEFVAVAIKEMGKVSSNAGKAE